MTRRWQKLIDLIVNSTWWVVKRCAQCRNRLAKLSETDREYRGPWHGPVTLKWRRLVEGLRSKWQSLHKCSTLWDQNRGVWSDWRHQRNRLKLGVGGHRRCTRRRFEFQSDRTCGWGDMMKCCRMLLPQIGRKCCTQWRWGYISATTEWNWLKIEM